MQGRRLGLVILLVVLAGCTMPFSGGEGEMADDAVVSTEGNEIADVAAESDDTDGEDERELTEEEAERVAGYENMARTIEMETRPPGARAAVDYWADYTDIDGERIGVAAVRVEVASPRDVPELAGYAAYPAPHALEDAGVAIFAADDPQEDNVRPDAVLFEYQDANGELVGSFTIDVDTAREFAQGDVSGEVWARQTMGTFEESDDHQVGLPDFDANEALYAPEIDNLVTSFDSRSPDYTTYTAATGDGPTRILDAAGGTGYGMTVELDEEHDLTTEITQSVNTLAFALYDRQDDLNETDSIYLDGPPEYVELEYRDSDGELLGWIEVDVEDAIEYMTEDHSRSAFAAATLGDFQNHQAGLYPEPDDPGEALREAELRSFASTYEHLVLEADRFPVNATYTDLDREAVMIHGFWTDTDRRGNLADQTTLNVVWHTMLIHPERHYPGSKVAFYIENSREDGNKVTQNDNRGFAETEAAIEVVQAHETDDEDKVQIGLDWEWDQNDNTVILGEDAINPANQPQDKPFSEDDDGW